MLLELLIGFFRRKPCMAVCESAQTHQKHPHHTAAKESSNRYSAVRNDFCIHFAASIEHQALSQIKWCTHHRLYVSSKSENRYDDVFFCVCCCCFFSSLLHSLWLLFWAIISRSMGERMLFGCIFCHNDIAVAMCLPSTFNGFMSLCLCRCVRYFCGCCWLALRVCIQIVYVYDTYTLHTDTHEHGRRR